MYRASLFSILLGMIASDAVGVELEEFVGNWVSTYPLTRGESNTLNISDTLEVTFVRDFGGVPETQEFEGTTESLQFIDGVLIVDFSEYPSTATYKLVLSVFENPQHELVIEGTAYMYLDGAMVNGMHLALRKGNES